MEGKIKFYNGSKEAITSQLRQLSPFNYGYICIRADKIEDDIKAILKIIKINQLQFNIDILADGSHPKREFSEFIQKSVYAVFIYTKLDFKVYAVKNHLLEN